MQETIIKKIEQLIETENNHVERSKLLLLLQMSQLIADASETNAEVIDKLRSQEDLLQKQIDQYQSDRDKMTGARKVVASLFFIAQAVGGYFLYQAVEIPKKSQDAIIQIDKRLSILESKIKVVQ